MDLPTLGISPVPLTDPALWPYLAEPELFFLVATMGVRYTWLQLDLCRTMALLRLRRARAAGRRWEALRPARQLSSSASTRPGDARQ